MRRNAGALVLVAALGGCMTPHRDGPIMAGPGCPGQYGVVAPPPSVPGVQAGWGQPLAMAQPYAMRPPGSDYQAYQMMSRSVPMDLVRTSGQSSSASNNSGIVQADFRIPFGGCGPGGCMPSGPIIPGQISPPGVPCGPGCGQGVQAPNAMMLPGGTPMMPPAGFTPPPNAVAAVGAAGAAGGLPGGAIPAGSAPLFPIKRTQVRFVRPSGMKVAWQVSGADGRPSYSPTVLETPGRYNFLQAAIYRLKLSNIEGRPGLEVYPTVEVVPANPKTDAFLAHSAVPVEFTNEDFDQIAAGNYVVKVIYLPDPQFQEVAATGIEEITSTRLPPGVDPITEALRRGCILLVIRMGNMDQEAPNTPPIDAPAGGGAGGGINLGVIGGGPMGAGGLGADGSGIMPPGSCPVPPSLPGPVSNGRPPASLPVQQTTARVPTAPPALPTPPVSAPAALATQGNAVNR
jgi:hypothetical protein